MIPKSLPLIRRKSDFPLLQRLRRQTAACQIIARSTGRPRAQLQPKILHGQFHYLGQLGSLVGFFLRARVLFGHGHSCLTRQNLDRLHKAYILGLAHKRDRIPFGMASEAIVESLAVIDVEAG